MCRFILTLTVICCFVFTDHLNAAIRTWSGIGAGGTGTDFNAAANWTGTGPLLATDDLILAMTVSGGGDVFLSANVTVNSINMSMNSGVGLSYANLNAAGFILTVQGPAFFEGTQFIDASNWDFCGLHAASSGGGFILKGTSDFNSAGIGDVYFKADVSNPGFVQFEGDITIGAFCYTTPTDEPDFIWDGTGAQLVTVNSIGSYIMGENMTFGVSNTPSVTLTGSSPWRVNCYKENVIIAAGVTVDLEQGGMDNFEPSGGATFTLGAGATLRIGATSAFPGDNLWSDFEVYSLDPSSTVEYYGTTQTIKGTNVAYGHINLTGSSTKTSGSDFSIAGDFTNDVTFDHNNNTHTFNGTANQNIGGTTSPTTFYNLVVNKSNTLNSAIDLIVENELDMTSGTFLLDGETVTCNNMIDINGGTLRITGGTLTMDEDSDTSFDMDGGTFDIGGGTVNIGLITSQSDADLNLDGGTLDISAGVLHIVDELDMDGGNLNVSGTAEVNVKAATGPGAGTADSKLSISAGTTNISGGTIYVFGAYDNTSAYPAIDYNPTTNNVTGGTIVCTETGSDDESFYINTHNHNIWNLTVDKTAITFGSTDIWMEDFNDLSQGTETDGLATAWTTACTSGIICGLNDGSSTDYLEVRYNAASDDYRFAGRDMDNEGYLQTESIDISSFSNVSISIGLAENSYDNTLDYIRCFYSLDGGPQTLLTNGDASGNFGTQTATATGLNGSTLVIYVYIMNNGRNDIGYVDDIFVRGNQAVDATYMYLGGDLNIDGDLLISNGKLDVTTSSRAINLAGNWTNNDVFEEQAGTVTFDGGTSQRVASNGTTETFYNVVFNNTSTGVQLNDDLTVTNHATFTDGVVSNATGERVIISDNATVSGASNASHVDGNVRKIGDDAFTFPVGNNNEYRWIGISAPGSTTDNFTANYTYSDPDPSYSTASFDASLTNISRCEYWILDRTSGTSGVEVSLSWNSISCGVNVVCDLRVARWDGGTWKDHGNGGTTGGVGAGSLVTGSGCGTPSTVSDFSPFTLASINNINPLPVELVYFNAKRNDKIVDFTWKTLSETENDYFTVERSKDGVNFKPILEVNGAGNSNVPLNYYQIDPHPLTGINYYRLKQTDFDYKFTYSDIVAVKMPEPGDISIYLNSVLDGNIGVRIGNVTAITPVRLVMYDQTGRLISAKSTWTENGRINWSLKHKGLAAGIYIIQVDANGKTMQERLVLR